MKLADDEIIINEHSLNEKDTGTSKMILTDKRLIITRGRDEEYYPLTKMTGVKFTFSRFWGLIAIGALLIGVGFYGLGSYSSATQQYARYISVYEDQMQQYETAVAARDAAIAERDKAIAAQEEAAKNQTAAQKFASALKSLVGLDTPLPTVPPAPTQPVLQVPPSVSNAVRQTKATLPLYIGALLPSFACLYFGWRGGYALTVLQMGERKDYRLQRKTDKLVEFVGQVASRLS